MRPVTYYVIQIGDQWSVACSYRDDPTTIHPDRTAALRHAQDRARCRWDEQRVASEVRITEDDGAWHPVASFGSLLG
ncbi:MAG: hypothetical protein NDI59_03820 [Lysobacter sp.]|jgi:hypothetical protein|nr:hypothetical protein [Lysobacter sp.]